MRRRHTLVMLLCCLIPLGGIAVALAMGVPLKTGVLVGVLLLCPVLHVLLMGSMDHDHGHSVALASRAQPGDDGARAAVSAARSLASASEAPRDES